MKIVPHHTPLAINLGLKAGDIAEIGGFSDRFARDLFRYKAKWQPDLVEALKLIEDDVDVICDTLVSGVEDGRAAVPIYRNTADLRAFQPDLPRRGKAGGFFIGPYMLAALAALEALSEHDGVDVDFVLID